MEAGKVFSNQEIIDTIEADRSEGKYRCMNPAHRRIVQEHDRKQMVGRYRYMNPLHECAPAERPCVSLGTPSGDATGNRLFAIRYTRLVWFSAGYFVEIEASCVHEGVRAQIAPTRQTALAFLFNLDTVRFERFVFYHCAKAAAVTDSATSGVAKKKRAPTLHRPFIPGHYYVPVSISFAHTISVSSDAPPKESSESAEH